MPRHATRRQFWMLMLSVVLFNGIVLTSLLCSVFPGVGFLFWPLILLVQLGLSFPDSGQEWSFRRRAIAVGSGVCVLLLPLWLELCARVGHAPS